MHFVVSELKDKQRVTLSGDLAGDIDSDLAPLLRTIKKSHVIFDCRDVRHINSIGLKHWVRFLEGLQGKASVEFHNCPVFFIDYANMVPDLVESGAIVSFFAPLRCAPCNHSASILLLAEEVDIEAGFGRHLCPKCNRALEPEVQSQDYLAFLDPAL